MIMVRMGIAFGIRVRAILLPLPRFCAASADEHVEIIRPPIQQRLKATPPLYFHFDGCIISVPRTISTESLTPALIRTKLHRPPLPSDWVPRPQSLAHLDQQRERPLVLVSAPLVLARALCSPRG